MKRKLFSVIFALLLCFTLLFTACGAPGDDSIDSFEKAYSAVNTPITKDSADSINKAYDKYYMLSDEDKRQVADEKAKLDGYADICNAILLFLDEVDNIGEYTVYSEYSVLVSAASQAYDALVALQSSAADDKDVKAAKAEFDKAADIVGEKDELINGYVQAVSAVGDYDASSTLYSEWAAAIVKAQTLYEQISDSSDDMITLASISEARKQLSGRLETKAELDAVIQDFKDKTAAAELAFDTAFGSGEADYNESVNAAIDAAEEARLAAAAFNLTSDAVLASDLAVLVGLHSDYDGVRYGYEFTQKVTSAESMLTDPLSYDKLKLALEEAETIYGKIPEADRADFADEKGRYDAATAKLPEIEVQKNFIDATEAINVQSAINVGELETAFATADELYTELTEDFGYVSGIGSVDSAKLSLEQNRVDFTSVKALVNAVEQLPSEISNTREIYDELEAIRVMYDQMTETQRKATLAVSAYMRYQNAKTQFSSHMVSAISAAAKYKDGSDVPAGLNTLSVDTETNAILPEKALDNYLQVLYTAAAIHDGTLNGVALVADGSNVDAAEFDEYMSENFEYVYTFYDAVTGLEQGKVRKALHYDVNDNQVPTVEEIETCLPIYYGEATSRTYKYSVQICVKEDATDNTLVCNILDTEAVTSSSQGTVSGEVINKLTNERLVMHEDPTNQSGVVMLGRAGKGAAYVCGNGNFLNNAAIGAFDIYFYRGNSTAEEDLIDWARVIKKGTDNKTVQDYLGSSLEEKVPDLAVMTATEYDELGVTNITDVGYLAATKKGWVVDNGTATRDLHIRPNSMGPLMEYMGYTMTSGDAVTIVAKLIASDSAREAGVEDSDFCTPIVWVMA